MPPLSLAVGRCLERVRFAVHRLSVCLIEVESDLDKRYFSGKSDIPDHKRSDLETGCSESSIRETLTKLGWEGQTVCQRYFKDLCGRKTGDIWSIPARGTLLTLRGVRLCAG